MRERIDLSVKDDSDACTGISQQCPPPTIKIEKVNGGLRLFGVLVGNNCQISLPAFGILFVFIGVILTIVAFKGPETESSKQFEVREETTKNIKVLGPVCITVGLTMLVLALLLKYFTHKAEDKQTQIGFYCPVHGDFYPLSPGINPRKYSFSEFTQEHKWWPPTKCMKKNEIDADVIIPDIPVCPHSISPSNRSSFDGQHVHISNPNPNIVIITTAPNISERSASPEASQSLNSNSARSLSVPNDVVSFPSYRSRSNPPTSPPSPLHPIPSNVKRLSCPILPEIGAVSPLQIDKLTKFPPVVASVKAELKVVKPVDKAERSPYISNSSINSDDELKKRKSVSILLPPERYHHTRIHN